MREEYEGPAGSSHLIMNGDNAHVPGMVIWDQVKQENIHTTYQSAAALVLVNGHPVLEMVYLVQGYEGIGFTYDEKEARIIGEGMIKAADDMAKIRRGEM